MKHFIYLLWLTPLFSFGQLNFDSWEKKRDHDEFGDRNGKYRFEIFGLGQFSSSATTYSDLVAKLINVEGAFIILLYEYRHNLAFAGHGNKQGEIKVKLPDGRKKAFIASTFENGGIYFPSNSAFTKFLNESNGEMIKVSIHELDFGIGTKHYRFRIKTPDYF